MNEAEETKDVDIKKDNEKGIHHLIKLVYLNNLFFLFLLSINFKIFKIIVDTKKNDSTLLGSDIKSSTTRYCFFHIYLPGLIISLRFDYSK